ncbi:hypothetical protein BU17DRAFT_54245 [Hysterangium stoloniferum]|nr:hypothetical protein BU17DRAFT_54245 [Hysterangium stoloniferum]
MSSIIETQVLHTTTTRTLHAHNFSKSSTQATHTLTDVLSRYFTLLTETCARYAQHAGRTGVTIRDALAALNEVGVEVDELREYVEGEALELVRYTGQTAKRANELLEIRHAFSEGVKLDHSDALCLEYAPLPSDYSTSDGEDTDADVDSVMALNTESEYSHILTPPTSPRLPPSPISPPHTRKRLRSSNWKPPDHVPDFLPPFPGHALSPQVSPQLETASLIEKPSIPGPQRLSEHVRSLSPALPASSSNISSYHTAIPYEHSSLSSIPEWHLPKIPVSTSPLTSPSTLPALLSSHSYLQSSSLSAPSLLPPNPLRHGLAMMLLGLSSRAYSPAATLFASGNTNTCAPVPRRVAPVPTHAVPLDKHGKTSFHINAGKGALPVAPLDWHARSAGGPVAFVEPTSMQGSRVPILARTILSAPVLGRTTRILPPPPLERNDQKLLYGPPIPAPWNLNGNVGEGKGQKGGKDKDKNEEEEDEADRVLADAHLFATWDYDTKDFRAISTSGRRASKFVTGFGGGNGMMPPSIKRKRSESTLSGRRGSEAGSVTSRIKTER